MSLCAYCDKEFESAKLLIKHIRAKRGHGNEICENCGEPLSKCKDIGAIGCNFQCKRKTEPEPL